MSSLSPSPPTPRPPSALTTLVGGVGQLYQGDLDLGRRAVEQLVIEDARHRVVVEDLHYGAIAVVQRLEELAPDALVLVGAVDRGREPGTVEVRAVADLDLDPDRVQGAIHDAGTGYVDLDLVIEVAWGLDALPARTVCVEVEPATTAPGEELSSVGSRGLQEALRLVRREVELTPLFLLARWISASLRDRRLEGSEALDAMRDLLGALEIREREGRWERTFAERDRLRLAISEGRTSHDMDHADWATWWSLIEELDRLERWTGEQVT